MTPIELRHQLHQHPELSGKESATHDLLAAELQALHPSRLFTHVGRTEQEESFGIIAVWGDNTSLKTIAFRADIDALPIEEQCHLPYGSQTRGVAHKCGHDGHTATLFAFAQHLSHHPELYAQQNILLIFQPEEETGFGAAKIMASGILQQYDIQAVFGVHNLPGYSEGKVVVNHATFAAASSGLEVTLSGRQTHASTPHLGINPGLAVAEIITAINALVCTQPSIEKFRLATLIFVDLGEEAWGTSAGKARMGFTLRAYSNSMMSQLLNQAKTTIETIAEKYQLQLSFDQKEPFHACENSEEWSRFVAQTAAQLGRTVEVRQQPFNWSEDFAEYLLCYPGAFFGIGAGEEHHELHHPQYDFPDEIINPTAKIFVALATETANRKQDPTHMN